MADDMRKAQTPMSKRQKKLGFKNFNSVVPFITAAI